MKKLATLFIFQFLLFSAIAEQNSLKPKDNLSVNKNIERCDPFEVPFSEDFDSSWDLPECWSFTGQGDYYDGFVVDWWEYNSPPNSFFIYQEWAITLLTTPPIAEPISNLMLQFWASRYWGESVIKIGTVSDPVNATSFSEVQSITLTNNWQQYTVFFEDYSGTDFHIGFQYGSGSNWGEIFIDDIEVSLLQYFDLILIADPEEGGTVEGAGEYFAGQWVEVSAQHNPGFIFLHWSDHNDNIVSYDAHYVLQMPAHELTLTAHFTDQIPTISVNPDAFEESLISGETSSQTLFISNDGDGNLNWEISFFYTSKSVKNKGDVYDIDMSKWSKDPMPGSEINIGDGFNINSSECSPENLKTFEKPFRSIPHVLLLTSSGGVPQDPLNVKQALITTGLFEESNIDIIDNPTHLDLSDIIEYDAILMWTDYNFSNPVQIGNVLKEYVDNGGGLVISTYALTTNWAIQGAILDPGYSPFIPSHTQSVSGVIDMNSLADPDHPVFSGIDIAPNYWSNINYSNPLLNQGGILLASDTNGNKVVAENSNANIVGIVIFPSAMQYGNFETSLMFANALYYVSTSWLSAEPLSGSIFSGNSEEIEVTFNATDLFGGTYESVIRISSNDPGNPIVNIPVTLYVTGAPNISLSHEMLDFGNNLPETLATLPLNITNTGTDVLEITNITTAGDGFFTDDSDMFINPGQSYNLAVSFYSEQQGVFEGMLSFNTNVEGQEEISIPLYAEVITFPVTFSVHDQYGQPLSNAKITVYPGRQDFADKQLNTLSNANQDDTGRLPDASRTAGIELSAAESPHVPMRSTPLRGDSEVLMPGNWASANQVGTYRWVDSEHNPLGWVFGNNTYGDKATAMPFSVSEPRQVHGAYIWFGAAGSGSGHVHFRIMEYDGGIGAELGSVSIALNYVEVFATGTGITPDMYENAFYVEFDNPIVVSGDFAFAIDYGDLEWNAHGDGVGLASTVGSGAGIAMIKRSFGAWVQATDIIPALIYDIGIFPVVSDASTIVMYTDANGQASFDAMPGPYAYKVEKEGYISAFGDFNIEDQDVFIDVSLSELLNTYVLSLIAEPDGAGSLSGEGSYLENESINVVATAFTGYSFIQWIDAYGNTVSSLSSFEYIMPAENMTLTAHFKDQEIFVYHISEHVLNLYPNPASGKLFVTFTHGGDAPAVLLLMNLHGQVVLAETLTGRGRHETVLSLEGLTPGVYMLRLDLGNHLFIEKVLIK